jgi:uncharacterized protein (DUF427 family)
MRSVSALDVVPGSGLGPGYGLTISRVVPEIGLGYAIGDAHVRLDVAGATIVDSRRPMAVWERENAKPFFAFPYDEVRTDLLRPCRGLLPRHRVGAAEWFDLIVARERYPKAAWAYTVPGLSSHIAFDLRDGPGVRWRVAPPRR